MSDHSTGSLRDRLRARTEDNREKVKALVDEQLRTLAGELSQSVDDARRTIEDDIQRLTEDARRALRRPVLAGILAALGFLIVAAGLTVWLTTDIRTKIERRASLAVQIEEQAETLERIEATTWGVLFHEEEQGRFLVMPEGVEALTGWTVRDRAAVKLEER